MIRLPFSFYHTLPFSMKSPKYDVQEWSGSDTPELFEENLNYIAKHKKIFGDWNFETAEIKYFYNNIGMRIPFSIDADFDFSKYTVFLGCSHVEGVGVQDWATIPSLYENLTGNPTLNFGCGGASNEMIYHNLSWLLSQKTKPKQIIIIWSYAHRESMVLPVEDKKLEPDNMRLFVRMISAPRLADEYSANPIIKKYVNNEYFTQQILMKSCLYFKLVDEFKKYNSIADFNFFDPNIIRMPKDVADKFEKDHTFWVDESSTIHAQITRSVETCKLGKALGVNYGRDFIIGNYNIPPNKIKYWAGHYGALPNKKIVNYIIDNLS